MPNLPNYSSPLASEGIRPSDLGAEAWAQEGRRVGTFYHQMGQDFGNLANELQAHDDLQTSIAMSQKANQIDSQLAQEYATKRSDPNFNLQDWQSHVQEVYGQISNTDEQGLFGSVLGHSDKILAHAAELQNQGVTYWSKQALSDQMKIAADRAVDTGMNIEETSKKILQSDPAQLGDLLQKDGAQLGTLYSSAKIPANELAKEATRLKNAYAGAAMDGWINKVANTNGDPAYIQSIKELVHNPDGLIYKNATAEQLDHFDKTLEQAGKAAAIQTREVNKQDFDQKTSTLLGQYVQPDGSLRVPPNAGVALQQLSRHPGAEFSTIKSIGDLNDALIKQKERGTAVHDDPSTYLAFSDKAEHGNLTVQEIADAKKDGLLSDNSFRYFAKKIYSPNDPVRKQADKDFGRFAFGQKPAFVHGSGQISVDPATGNLVGGSTDPLGAINYSSFYRDAKGRYDAAYDRDPKEAAAMLDPRSPTYLGRIAPQYLNNKKNPDVTPQQGPLPRLNVQQAIGFKNDKNNRGKSFIGPDGQQYTVP